MKRFKRLPIILGVLASFISPINAQAVSSNPTPDCSAGSTCTITFAYSGDYYSWTVPSGITSVTFDVQGAQGGTGISGTGTAGLGGQVVGTLTTTPGSALYFYVGGKGAAGVSSNTSSGGFNGGGNGGYDTSYPSSYSGGAGGGASDIRSTASGTGYSNRLVVAGGGGGASGGCATTAGNGGGTTGGNGTYCGTAVAGGGGTSSAGGSAYTSRGSSTGSLGVGGSAGNRIAYGSGGGGGGYYGGGAGSSTQDHGSGFAGAGGGGSSYTHPTLVSSVTHTQGARSNNGVISITYLNAPTPTTFSTSQNSPTSTSSSISYSITFSQNVSSVANSDFSNSGTATGCTFSVSASSGTSFTLTVSGCGEGTLIPQVIANSVYGTVTSTNGPSSNTLTSTPIRLDRTAPTISSVSAPANGTYFPTNTPTFTVVFSESVTVTGTPRLTLTVGTSTEYANFTSMSDSKTALFRYTVGSDPVEFDTDGVALTSSLSLNGGSVVDLATNTLTNFSFTPPVTSSVYVAQPAAAPTIDSVTATSGQLDIYFTPGAARGSTTSTYQYSANGGAWTNRPSGTTASPITLTGLTNGTGYTIRLRATTNAGAGDSSTAVTETPTSILVTGDSTLTLTYGSSASTGAYSASGGTNTYTWSLGASLTGVSLSGTTVTAGSTTPAGTYTQTVRATDGNSQVGTKTLTITVNKASTSITIALPGSASNAALGGAVTITATVPRAGAVNFMLGGTTISGCGSSSAASTTATCSWTPASLGAVSLTATFTPTDTSNFETSTTTTLSITVVNGVSTVTLSLTGGTTTPPKGQAINIIAAVDQAGRITFMIDGKRIAGCNNKVANVGNVTCAWKPAVQKMTTITARLVPTNSVYNSSSASLKVQVLRRTGLR